MELLGPRLAGPGPEIKRSYRPATLPVQSADWPLCPGVVCPSQTVVSLVPTRGKGMGAGSPPRALTQGEPAGLLILSGSGGLGARG